MDEQCWDNRMRQLGGNLLQSWRWGEFKQRQGWSVVRLSAEGNDGAWAAQLLIKPLGPLGVAYVPCGPNVCGNHAAVFPRMMAEIDAACRRARAITLIMEPNQRFQLPGTFKRHGFVQWTRPFQPRTTMAIPVSDDAAMLARMHHKTRYHIRLAQRQGVVVAPQPTNPETIAAFHALHSETVDRNGLSPLPLAYFTDLLDAFGDRAELLVATAGGRPAAGALLARFGDKATYLFAGSSTQHRGQGAGASVVFGALQWAREHDCDYLDLGNAGTPGLRDFKSGFGGVTHAFPIAMERRRQPVLAWGFRHALARKQL